MIETKRKLGWRFLYGAVGCWIGTGVVAELGLGESPADAPFLALWLLGFLNYFAGLYLLVKARGRHGAWALLGWLFVVGWNFISKLEDRAPNPEGGDSPGTAH